MARKNFQVDADYPKGFPALPFLMVDTASYVGHKRLVVARSALAWIAIERSPWVDGHIRDVVIHDRDCTLNPTKRARFHPWHVDVLVGSHNYGSHLEALRIGALQCGATPEAIRHLGEIAPFTKDEVSTMANKLAKKDDKPAKAAKADKPAGGATKPKGNAEALKKAREAAADKGPDVRKITVVEKENPYREGSGRAASWEALKGAKTVEDYKSAGGKIKYIARWASEGKIKLS